MKRPTKRYQEARQKWIGCIVRSGGGRDNFILGGKLIRYNKGWWNPWVIELPDGRIARRNVWEFQVDTWTHPRFAKPTEDKEYEALLI